MRTRFGYGDWVRILPLSERMQETGEICVRGRVGMAREDILSQMAGKPVILLDGYSSFLDGKEFTTHFSISRCEHVRLSETVIEKIDLLEAHRELELKDIKVGDIIEGNRLSDLFYNITNSKMKKAIVWNTSGSGMSIITLDHTGFPNKYMSENALGNVYGDLAAAYNCFNVIGHTDLIKLKVHCDYVKPKYSGKKYACYGSLGAFLDNFNITMAELKKTLGYCPITKLFETGNFEEFEEAVNSNTSLRIKIIR